MEKFIAQGSLFMDNMGSVLITIKRVPESSDWWCAGQPDNIGRWRYSVECINKGIIRYNDHT